MTKIKAMDRPAYLDDIKKAGKCEDWTFFRTVESILECIANNNEGRIYDHRNHQLYFFTYYK
jgi:hypothetical protein